MHRTLRLIKEEKGFTVNCIMRQVIIKSQITNQPLRWAFLGGAHEAFLEATESEHRDYSKTTFEVLISRVGD
jgi:hypothetical protein